MSTLKAVDADVQYRQIFEATTDGLVVNDPETGLVVEVNPAFCRMHGYAYDELIGIHPTCFIHPDDHQLFADFLAAFHRGGTFMTRARDVRKDGSVFEVEVRAETFMFRGRPHLLGVVRDVSDAAEAHRQLETRVEERTRELNALVEVARQITEAQNVTQMIRRVLAQAWTIIDSDGAYLYLSRDGMYALEHGEGPPSTPMIASAEMPAIENAFAAGRGVVVHGKDRSAEWKESARVGLRPGQADLIAVPLIAAGDVIGFLSFHKVCGDHEHAPQVMELAQAIAGQLAVAVANVRLSEAAGVAAALDERNRIARDLHDAVSQTLFSTTMHSRAAELAIAKLGLDADHPVRQHITDVAVLTRAALAEIRSLIFELRPGALQEAGIGVALQKHTSALTARHGVDIDLHVPDERLPLTPPVEEQLYRIAQEALGNVIKHARASRVTVDAWRSEKDVLLRIADDGAGFDASVERPGHLGLRTMRERAHSIGGRLDVHSRPGSGSTVVVRVPAGDT